VGDAKGKNAKDNGKKQNRGTSLKAFTTKVMIVCLAAGTPAGAQTADTLSNGGPLFRTSDAVLAGGFIAATALVAMGNRRVQDLGLHAGGAVVLSNIVTGGIKVIAGRARPYVDSSNARKFHPMRGLREQDYQSFPSGHSTAAFAFASVVSAETGHWWPDGRWPVGIATYGLATLTGMSRIYNYKHWASDVLVGAAIGTITGLKVFRYQHSHPDNRIDGTFLRAGLQSTGGHWYVIVSAVPR
jgi:membrane-associated phospholipid phosphatase